MKKTIQLIMVLCVMAVVLSFVACGDDNSTETVAIQEETTADENSPVASTLEAEIPSDEISLVVTPVSLDGSLDQAFENLVDELAFRVSRTPFYALGIMAEILESNVSTTTVGFNFVTANPQDPNIDGHISLGIDLDAEAALLEGVVRIMGLPIDFTAVITSETFALQSRVIDGDNFYGITFDTFLEDAMVFAGYLGISPQEVEMIFNEFLGEIGEVFEALEMMDTLNIDVAAQEEWAQMYVDIFTSFFEGAEPTTANASLNRSGNTVDVNRTSFMFESAQIVDLFFSLLYVFEADELMQASFAMQDGTAFGGIDTSSFADIVSELRAELEIFEEEFTGHIEFATYIDENGRLAQMTFIMVNEFSGDMEEITITFDFGSSVLDTWAIELILDSDFGTEVALVWDFIETSRGYENILAFTDEGVKTNFVSAWNPSTGAFELGMGDGLEYLSFSGVFNTSGNGFELELQEIEIPFVGKLGLSLSMMPGAEVPNVDFINMDQWDMEIIDLVMNSIFGLLLM